MQQYPVTLISKLKKLSRTSKHSDTQLVKIYQKKVNSQRDKLLKQKITINKLELFRNVFHEFPFPLLIIENHVIKYVNEAWEKYTGYALKDIAGMKTELFEKNIDIDEIRFTVNELRKKKKIFKTGEFSTIKKDGTQFTSYRIMFPIEIANKVYYCVYYHDVNAMNSMDDVSSILNRRIIHILNSISDGFISLDKKMKITYMNNQAELILRTNKESVYGKVIWKSIPQFKKEVLYKTFIKAMDEQEIAEYTVKWENDKWYLIRLYPSYDRFSLYFYDKTVEKRREERKDDFISIASHEIKTPVTSISLYSQLIKKKLTKDKNSTLVNLINNMDAEVNRLQSLIDNLLDVNRIQSGKLFVNKSVFPLSPFIKEIIKQAHQLSDNHSIVIQKVSRGTINADKERLREVLINLFTNAVKYSPHGSTIYLQITKTGKEIIFRVQDKGIGIPTHMQGKIFERFTRIPNSRQQVSGMGLGLYICSEIIKQHNGKIWVDSIPGKGSTFSFSIPIIN